MEKTTKNGIHRITQADGKTIAWAEESGVKVLEKDGYYFKDLAKTGAQIFKISVPVFRKFKEKIFMRKNKSVIKKCKYLCHVLCQRVLGILPNKVASHFLRGDFV